MRTLALIVALAASACTEKNPNLCCTDAADCAVNGLSEASTCGTGLICRGNQCIAELCTTAQDCDASAPYCESGSCIEACSTDAECPGAGQSASKAYCVGGACAECRIGMDDCAGTTPVCGATNQCRACATNSECTSGVCEIDGHCVDSGQIAYVAPNGSTTTDCSKTLPCTLPLGIASTHPYVVVAGGTYGLFQTLVISGTKKLIGDGSRPVLTSTFPGTIIKLVGEGDVTLTNLKVTGATSMGTTAIGNGIECPLDATGTRTFRFVDTIVSGNAADGMYGRGCTVFASHSVFSSNGAMGLDLQDGSGTIDACTIIDNQKFYGVSLDGGQWSVTNSVIAHNVNGIYQFSSAGVVSRFDFNTVVDNTKYGVDVQADGAVFSGANNLVVRNLLGNIIASSCPTACTFPGTIALSDPATVHFKSADAQPYDYHLTAGSVAIDAAINGTLDHDMDGEVRPKGAARDVGADEAQ